MQQHITLPTPQLKILSPYLDGSGELDLYAVQFAVSDDFELALTTSLVILAMQIAESRANSPSEFALELSQLQTTALQLGVHGCSELYPGIQVKVSPEGLGSLVTVIGCWPLPATEEGFATQDALFYGLGSLMQSIFGCMVEHPFTRIESPHQSGAVRMASPILHLGPVYAC